MAMDKSTKSSLPSYSEMILGAIEALDDKAGSNTLSISRYIESKYADQLPEAHLTLLAAHLARMKESGEIVMLQNNYLKAGPDGPLKRGRGRPPKPRDPLAAAVEKASSGMPKPRGRPPKKARADGEEGPASVSPGITGSAGAVPGVKRGRGRPPKVKPPFADVGFA